MLIEERSDGRGHGVSPCPPGRGTKTPGSPAPQAWTGNEPGEPGRERVGPPWRGIRTSGRA